MKTKVCCKCHIEKEITDFGKSLQSKDGLSWSCKKCNNERGKKYRKDNYKKTLETTRNWTHKNPEKVYNRHKKYRLKNLEKINERIRKYFKNNPEKRKEYRESYKTRKHEQRKERKLIDPIFKLTGTMRSRLYKFLKSKNITKRNKTFEIVGCTPEFLKEHLENQFTEKMCWENHGNYGWHIDHIVPLDFGKNEDEIYKLCHYTNLQPLWWDENLSKSSKII